VPGKPQSMNGRAATPRHRCGHDLADVFWRIDNGVPPATGRCPVRHNSKRRRPGRRQQTFPKRMVDSMGPRNTIYA
jgi:hypothetical protein